MKEMLEDFCGALAMVLVFAGALWLVPDAPVAADQIIDFNRGDLVAEPVWRVTDLNLCPAYDVSSVEVPESAVPVRAKYNGPHVVYTYWTGFAVRPPLKIDLIGDLKKNYKWQPLDDGYTLETSCPSAIGIKWAELRQPGQAFYSGAGEPVWDVPKYTGPDAIRYITIPHHPGLRPDTGVTVED